MTGTRLSIAVLLLWAALVLPQSAWSIAQAGAQAGTQPAGQTANDSAPVPAPGSGSSISPPEFAARLQSLDQLVARCQGSISAANCQRDSVGPDVRVALPAGVREVRFGWLRELMDQAAKGEPANSGKAATSNAKPQATKDTSAGADSKKPSKDPDDEDSDDASSNENPQSSNPEKPFSINKGPEFPPPTLSQRLTYARERLAADQKMAGQLSGEAADQTSANSSRVQKLTSERHTLDQILAEKEYHTTVVGPSIRDRVLERVARWINQAISKVAAAGFKSEWVGRAAEIAFVVVLCIVLVWFLIRLERQGRLGPAFIRPGSGTGAASARDWQLWLQDARLAAAAGAWRDAIHLLYWASISRLESGGLWPADRARTPREYLALVSRESEHRSDLSALTRSFERTWYAGRAAAEADFRQAEQIAGRLGAR